ncbi:nuclear envelope pore membrane protein POM 121 [Gastrophryne carolinensis]
MCPSSGHGGGGGLRERLRRALGYWRNLEEQPHDLLLPVGALLLLIALYCLPLLSLLLLLCAAAVWLYRGCPDWRPLVLGAAGRRQRAALHRRYREPVVRWTPSSLLLLMGSYLGKQEPPPRVMGRGTLALKERLARPNPTVATPARRLSFRETPAASSRAFLSPRRRYPIHQPQYSMPGSLPTVYLDGFQKKALLSPKSYSVRSPVTVKIARPDPNVTRSPMMDNLRSPEPVVQFPPDPCAKETVLNAIKESRKRMNKEEHGSSGGLESKRSPDGLKRGLNLQALDDHVNKRSRTSSISSLNSSALNGPAGCTHNAITSSYSSSRELLQKRKRGLQNTSAVSSSPSSRSQTPDLSAKKSREESHETSLSTSVNSDRNNSGTLNETPLKSSSVNSSAENVSIDARRKKVLLVSGSRDQYPLPPPPLVGYSITSKDFDSAKKASLQRLNKALEVVSVPPPLSSGSSTLVTPSASLFSLATSSSSLSLPTSSSTVTASTAATDLPTASNSNPLLLSLSKIQDKESPHASSTLNVDHKEKAPASVSLACPEPVKPSDSSLKMSSFSASPASETVNVVPPAPATQAATEPPKSSLLQILTKPLENTSQPSFTPVFPTSVAATTPATTGPSATVITSTTFKPIFGEQSKQDAPSSSTFKPIFGSSLAQPPASTAPFTFQTNTAASSASSLFSAVGAKNTNAALGTDNASKPSMAPATSASSTSNTFTSSLFPSATTTSGSSSTPINSILGSNAPATAPAKSFVFGQVPTSQTTSGLNVFNNAQSSSTSAPQQPSLFGSSSSAFTAAVGTSNPTFTANSGTSAFTNSQGTGVKTETPVQSSVTGFGSSVTSAFGTGTQLTFGNTPQPTFGASSQPAFGTNTNFSLGNSTPVSKGTFGNTNSTQANSTPAANVFGSKPFAFGDNANSAQSFGTPNAAPAQSFSFGNSLAQNNRGITNPSTVLNFATPGPAETKPAFAASFGQSSPAVAPSFATSTPAQPFGNPASFGQPGGGFSIGVTPKPSAARQRVMARRQHQRKK